jgi:hypothetical protein
MCFSLNRKKNLYELLNYVLSFRFFLKEKKKLRSETLLEKLNNEIANSSNFRLINSFMKNKHNNKILCSLRMHSQKI